MHQFPLEIGGHTYTVYIEDKYSVDGEGHAGTRDGDTLKICVATLTIDGQKKAQSVIEAVFWHEVIHAINDHGSNGLCEEQVDRFAEGLMQIFAQFGWKALPRE
jgi:hypothetical protein